VDEINGCSRIKILLICTTASVNKEMNSGGQTLHFIFIIKIESLIIKYKFNKRNIWKQTVPGCHRCKRWKNKISGDVHLLHSWSSLYRKTYICVFLKPTLCESTDTDYKLSEILSLLSQETSVPSIKIWK
jgi:hypothetical protein